jgi:hypothetical protein
LDGADPAGTGAVPANGATVATWADKSGNGKNGTILTGTPTYDLSARSVSFDGSSTFQLPNSTIAPGASTFTIFAICRPTSLANYPYLFFAGNGGAGTSVSLVFYPDGSVENGFWTDYMGVAPAGSVSANVTYLFSSAYNGTSRTLFRNGTDIVTGIRTVEKNIGAGNNIVGGAGPVGTSFSGTISEMIVYNTLLGTAQRQSVEGYLGWKWGLETPTTTSLPTSIPSCVLWLDGADSTRTANIATGVWLDKSGLGSNTTSNAGSSAFSMGSINGLPAVTFPAASASALRANATLATSTGVTVFLVASTSTNRPAGSRFLYGNIGSFDLNMIGTVFPVSMRFAASGMTSAVTGNFITTSPFVYSATSTSTVLNAWINGINNAVGTANPALSITSLTIGNFATPSSTYAFTGQIGEILIYNRTLTTAERQFVEAYLGRKWSVSVGNVVLPNTHPFYSIQPFGRYFNPIDVPGCQLWLDGADPAGTGVLPANGANVATWVDKSGNGYNATANGTPATYGTNAVVFAGAQNYGTSLSSTLLNQSGFAVVSYTGSSKMNIFSVNSISGSAGLQQIIQSGSQIITSYGGATVVSGGAVPESTIALYNYTFNSGVNAFVYLNGTQTGTSTGAAISGAGTISIGSYNNNGAAEPFVGNMYELLLYNTVLSQSQRQQIEGYLAWKWGLQPSLPATGHSFKTFPPSSPLPFSPVNISGCSLWLDAADASSVTGTTTVTLWKDKSGNARNLSVGSGTTSYANNAVTLNSSYMFVNSPVNLMAFTMFIIVKSNSASINNQTILIARPNTGFDYDSPDGFGLYINYQNTGQFYGRNIGSQYVNLYAPGLSGPTMLSFTTGITTINAFVDGGSVTGASGLPTRSSTAQGFAIGAAWSGSAYNNIISTASIYEILVYNRSLTTPQRQSVEGYLAWKWGLQASLPSTHLYYRFPSALNPGSIFDYALTYLPLTGTTDAGKLPQSVTNNGTVTFTTIAGRPCMYAPNSLSTYLSFPYTNQTVFTLCFWLYPLNTGYYTAVSITNPDLNNPALQVDITGSSTTIYTAMPNQWTNQPTGTTGGANTWTHFAITVNQSTFVEQLYLNGTLAATATGTGSTISSRTRFVLGRSGDGGRAYFGYISQFAFFPTALNASEISTVYQTPV